MSIDAATQDLIDALVVHEDALRDHFEDLDTMNVASASGFDDDEVFEDIDASEVSLGGLAAYIIAYGVVALAKAGDEVVDVDDVFLSCNTVWSAGWLCRTILESWQDSAPTDTLKRCCDDWYETACEYADEDTLQTVLSALKVSEHDLDESLSHYRHG